MQANKKFLVICISILITSGCSTLTSRDIDTLPAPAALPEKSEQGHVDIWFYDNVSISSVTDLAGLARYPDNPDEVLRLNRLEGPTNRGDRYAGLVRGYITAPADGQYRFFMTSDDDGQFLLSDSVSPSEARVIASVPGFTKSGEFNKYSSQTSGDITLSSGQRYYFEMRYREANGRDQFAVAWQGPGFSQAVIDGQYLSSFSQALQIYPDDAQSAAGYELGYRVGFFDGKQAMPFTPAYPPLDNDQDRLYDNWEAFYGLDSTNPNDSNADSDNDILTNYDEFWVGSSPTNADSDGDGIPDGDEFAYGLDALDPTDAQADLDNDGFSNLEEYEAGSDLTDVEDMPVQEAIDTPQLLPHATEPSQSSVTLIWTAPLTRVDGSSLALGEIKGYELTYSQQHDSLNKKIDIPGQETRYTIEQLVTGTWYFQLRTYDYNDLYSQSTEALEYIVK
jgi:hypothetical protein